MDKNNTILYNIMYQDGKASQLIPALKYAGNALPKRFDKKGETISLDLNHTVDTIRVQCSSPHVKTTVTKDRITITFEPNVHSSATREARIYVYRCDASGCHRFLQFVIHQD